MKQDNTHLAIHMGGLGLCLFILFFGTLVGDVALSNDDMELFPKIVILLMAAVCIGISIRLLLKKGFAWERIGEEAYKEKRSSINRWVYEYFHPFKIRYEDAPEDSTELEKKLTGFRSEYEKFCKGGELQYTVTNFYRHILQLQKKRLERMGLRMEVALTRKCYTKEIPVKEERFYDGRFMHTAASEHVAGFYRYLQGDRIVYEKTNNDCADYDMVGAKKARDGQTMHCPNCGAEGKIEEMASGCPYCGVRFRMEDLSERVSSFSLRKDYRLLENVFQSKLYAYGKTIIFIVAFLFCALALWWIEPLEGLTVTGLSFGVGAFLFTLILCLLVTVLSVSVVSLPLLFVLGILYNAARPSLFPHVKRERRNETLREKVARFDTNFSLQDFFSNVENKLSGIHFAETETQVNAYSGMNLSELLPRYRNVASCAFDNLELLDFRVEKEKQMARVRAEMQLLLWQNGTMTEKTETVQLLLSKAADCLTQAVFEPEALRCRGCGASIDLMEGRYCSFCGRELELERYDWCVKEYEVI